MQLLERNNELELLSQIAEGVRSGKGKVVYVFGEAGIGKTSLTEYFTESLPDDFNILKGTCDDLLTPRPLSPLFDIAFRTDPQLVKLLKEEAGRSFIFSYFHNKLSKSSQPNLLIIEDVHWADEATSDFIKFIGRRITTSNTMLVLTFRDDEVDNGHPLKNILSEISSESSCRINLKPLSRESIAKLLSTDAQHTDEIFAITQGNPFYVTEMIACREVKIPNSIKDAVMARINQLSDESISFLQAVSVVPSRAEHWLMEELFPDKWDFIDECFSRKILVQEFGYIRFRHELARIAVEESIPFNKKNSIHKRILNKLLDHVATRTDLTRIVHHAKYAGDIKKVLEFAPKAAEQAILYGAHRQAAAHFGTALEYSNRLSKEEQALLMGKYAYECYLIEKIEEAFFYSHKALEIWIKMGNEKKTGSCYRFISRLYWFSGNKELAEEYGKKAIDKFRNFSPSRESIMAISNLSQLKMLDSSYQEAIEYGNRAIQLAKKIHDDEILAHALNNMGSTLVLSNLEIGSNMDNLLKSLEISLANNFEEHVARAYTNISYGYMIHKDFKNSEKFLDVGIEYSTQRDLESWEHYMKAIYAQVYFETGMWEKVEKITSRLLNKQSVRIITRIPLLSVVGRLNLRRGNPDSKKYLDEAYEMAVDTRESQRIKNAVLGKAELAWLDGDLKLCKTIIKDALELLKCKYNPIEYSELLFWLWISGEKIKGTSEIFAPYQYLFKGDWKRSAKLWRHYGCPYDEALSLLFGNEDHMRCGLKIAENLRAQPLIYKFRQQMRARGIKNIATGPRQSTLENPAFLTNRQIEVLNLVSGGFKNQEIADKLFISTKTVDHHISAILSKLDTDTRSKAVARAKTLGII